MQIHELKTWQEYFSLVADGTKRFEWRKNDRHFKKGDLIYLRETYKGTGEYTGRVQLVQVTCVVFDTGIGIPEGYVVMGITPVTIKITPLEQEIKSNVWQMRRRKRK